MARWAPASPHPETRTGDTPANHRARQRARPHIYCYPRSLLLLLSLPEAQRLFAGLSAVVIDRCTPGRQQRDQLALYLARLQKTAPAIGRLGLSAAMAHPSARLVLPTADARDIALIVAGGGAEPRIDIVLPEGHLPWGEAYGQHIRTPEIYRRIAAARVNIVFVNTRAQAELMFQALAAQ